MKKKTKKVQRKTHTQKHELVVRVEPASIVPTASELASPVQDGGKYMIPKTWMSERQVLRLVQNTPKQHVYTRPGKGGQIWQYVTGSYVEKVLNYTFGWNWDFEVQNHGKEQDMVWVLGKLTVKDDKGHSITKTQFGRADIKFKKGTKEMLDFGNDLKSATTDSLKKCASLLGIASDIYGKTEYKQETGNDVASERQNNPGNIAVPQKESEQIIDYVCSVGGEDITKEEGEYSKKVYGRMLCRTHQKDAKRK